MLFRTNDTDRVPVSDDRYDFHGINRLYAQRDAVEETDDDDDEYLTASEDEGNSVERREALIATVVESVMSEQLRVMSQQLVTLRNMFPRYVVATDVEDEGTDDDDENNNEERGTIGGQDDESSSSDGSFDESSSG